MRSSRNYKPIHSRAMTKKQIKQMCEGVPEPDIVKEGKACLMTLVLFVCAILVVAAVCGAFWLVSELVKSLC
jgi:hypothetical protein